MGTNKRKFDVTFLVVQSLWCGKVNKTDATKLVADSNIGMNTCVMDEWAPVPTLQFAVVACCCTAKGKLRVPQTLKEKVEF